MNKDIAEKMTMHFATISEPCRMYNTIYKWYRDGLMSEEIWNDYCFACLKSLMKNNKDVLDRLKNI